MSYCRAHNILELTERARKSTKEEIIEEDVFFINILGDSFGGGSGLEGLEGEQQLKILEKRQNNFQRILTAQNEGFLTQQLTSPCLDTEHVPARDIKKPHQVIPDFHNRFLTEKVHELNTSKDLMIALDKSPQYFLILLKKHLEALNQMNGSTFQLVGLHMPFYCELFV